MEHEFLTIGRLGGSGDGDGSDRSDGSVDRNRDIIGCPVSFHTISISISQ